MSWHEEAAIRREQERFVDQYQARSDAERSARPRICACPDWALSKGPYPSGFCPDCNHYYPSKSAPQTQEKD